MVLLVLILLAVAHLLQVLQHELEDFRFGSQSFDSMCYL